MKRTSTRRPAKRTPPCPECGSAEVVPIIHGIPTLAQAKAIKHGKAILADREEWEGMTEWRCDGKVGFGLSEYLDQIVDGQPVGGDA